MVYCSLLAFMLSVLGVNGYLYLYIRLDLAHCSSYNGKYELFYYYIKTTINDPMWREMFG